MLRLVFWIALLLGAATMVAPGVAEAQSYRPRVEAVQIEGTQRIEPDTVRSYVDLKVGDEFTPEMVDKSLKTLFATGLFADVQLTRQGSTLVVTVVENPIINRLSFEGNKRIETSKLTDEVQLKARTVYTKTKVQNDVARILEVYRRSGRFAATVEPKIVKLDQNRVDLVFEINEGSLTGIGRISIVGNHRFTTPQLKEVLQTKETRWYRFLSSDDNYDPDRVTYDRELLRRYYLKNGFADFRVLSAVAELAPDRKSFYLTFTVEEGFRYKLASVDIRSSIKELDPSTLKSSITTPAGSWYNSEEVENSIKRLTDEVGNKGYAFVEIEPVMERDRAKHTMSLTYEIREGPKVYVERIDIIGNVRTLDSVIRREFRLVEGDAFNTSKVRRSERRLKDLQFFKKVEVTNIPGSAPDRTIIQTKVEEQSTGQVSLGAGFSTTDGVLGQFGVSESNLLGRGQDLRATATLAQRRQEYDLSFTEPYFLGRDVSSTYQLFRVTRDLQTDAQFNEESTGGSIGFGYNFTEHLRHNMRFTVRQDRITDVQTTASAYIREQQGTTLGSIFGQDFFYDRLDSRVDPSEGYYVSQGNDLAGFGGDLHYLRTRLKGGYYYPITPRYIVSVRGEGGHIFAFGSERVRINDRFFLGGDNFRGFKVGGAGPRDVCSGDALGGNTYFSQTTELQFPLGLPEELGISGRVFNDFGSSFGIDINPNVTPISGCNGPSDIRDSSALRASAGFGVSWKSPFGPVRVDIARPYVKQESDRSQIFRFSFGTKF